jgi:hypothetical protein
MRHALLALTVVLAGCSTIQTHERLDQDTGHPLSTYIGGQVLKIHRTSDLPNAFGKADVFGGKVNRGYTEVRYQGFASEGHLIFRVTEVETESTETTMSRYGGSTSTINAQQVGNGVVGTVTTYDAPQGSTERLPPNTIQFVVDLGKTKDFTVAGTKVRILGATETSLNYELSQ